MSSFAPPLPTAIGGSSGGGGSSLVTTDSSIVLSSSDTGSSAVVISTANTPAIVVDDQQNVLVGDASYPSVYRLAVVAPDQYCFELKSNSHSAYFSVTSSGNLSISSSGDDINFSTNNIKIGNGALYLGGARVSSTAEQLNYLITTKGTAMSEKALVLDSSTSIAGINSLSATTLLGTIQTASQPNITQLSTININTSLSLGGILVSSTAPELNYVHITPGTVEASKALVVDSGRNISGIMSLSATNLTGTIQSSSQPNITSVGTLALLNISGSLGVGTASPTTDLELFNEINPVLRLNNGSQLSDITIDINGNLRLIPNGDVMIQSNHSLRLNGSGEITGATLVSATTLSGTLQTSTQPNITSVGALTDLVVTNSIGLGTFLPAKKMEIVESSGDCLRITKTETEYADVTINSTGDLLLSPSAGNVRFASGVSLKLTSADITGVGSITATNLIGTIQTVAQPNITSVGTLTTLSVTNGIICNSVDATNLTGTIQTPAQPNITSVGILSNLTITTTLSVASVLATNLTGVIQTAVQPNITSVGTLSSLAITNTLNVASVLATDLTGTIQTADQPNITSIGILTNITITNTLTTANVLATNLTGTIQTASQTNITAIGTLNTLAVTNGITCTSVDATNLAGTIQTPAQPNITSVGILDSLSVTAGINCGSLVATNLTGTIQTSSQTNIRTLGTLTNIYTSGKIGVGTVSPTFDIDIISGDGNAININYNEMAVSGGASLTGDIVVTTAQQRLVLANSTSLRFTGTGGITGLASISATTIDGTLTTAAQPNITSLGFLESLGTANIRVGTDVSSIYNISVNDINGKFISLTDGTVTVTERIIAGDYTITSSTGRIVLADGVGLILNAGIISGVSTLTVAQANITSISALASLALTGPITGATTIAASGIVTLTDITASTSTSTGALVVAGGVGVGGTLTASNLVGNTITVSQANITTLGALTNLNLIGSLGVGTDSPVTQLEVNSTTGNCLRLSYDKDISASNYASLTVGADGTLTIASSSGNTIINQFSSNNLILGNTTNNTMPLEIGYTSFIMSAAYAYNTNLNSHGTIAAGGTTAYNYSIRALGRILCTQSVDVTSDRRLKTNIQELDDSYCTKFIEETTPVSFNMINGDNTLSYGYIAQDLLRHGFDDLVNLALDDQMQQEVDEDGLISPQGVKFTISYQHIIPILAQNQKKLMQENKELQQTVAKLLEMVQQLMR